MLEFNDLPCQSFSYDFCHFQPFAPALVFVGCWRTIYVKCLRWYTITIRKPAQGSPLLRVAAKCKAVEPSKSTQVTGHGLHPSMWTYCEHDNWNNCNKDFLQFSMHLNITVKTCTRFVGKWKVMFFWLVNLCLPSSIIARASNKTLVAKPSRTKCKGVRPWRSPQCAKKMKINDIWIATVKYCYMF